MKNHIFISLFFSLSLCLSLLSLSLPLSLFSLSLSLSLNKRYLYNVHRCFSISITHGCFYISHTHKSLLICIFSHSLRGRGRPHTWSFAASSTALHQTYFIKWEDNIKSRSLTTHLSFVIQTCDNNSIYTSSRTLYIFVLI